MTLSKHKFNGVDPEMMEKFNVPPKLAEFTKAISEAIPEGTSEADTLLALSLCVGSVLGDMASRLEKENRFLRVVEMSDSLSSAVLSTAEFVLKEKHSNG